MTSYCDEKLKQIKKLTVVGDNNVYIINIQPKKEYTPDKGKFKTHGSEYKQQEMKVNSVCKKKLLLLLLILLILLILLLLYIFIYNEQSI